MKFWLIYSGDLWQLYVLAKFSILFPEILKIVTMFFFVMKDSIKQKVNRSSDENIQLCNLPYRPKSQMADWEKTGILEVDCMAK